MAARPHVQVTKTIRYTEITHNPTRRLKVHLYDQPKKWIIGVIVKRQQYNGPVWIDAAWEACLV